MAREGPSSAYSDGLANSPLHVGEICWLLVRDMSSRPDALTSGLALQSTVSIAHGKSCLDRGRYAKIFLVDSDLP